MMKRNHESLLLQMLLIMRYLASYYFRYPGSSELGEYDDGNDNSGNAACSGSHLPDLRSDLR